ncbi:MSMEG_4193 family putative phosphomutase [Longispora albida]|uniref:MSMEG_4193 family putative phosphomutase n=1 Tax=Longispora albida TaxID=203523 RepID=UPI00036824F6|nr:MSMEG_4193 family putative phosphomutase [Longispora albida]
MATVLLLRHGRSTANSAGILAGDLPVPLDETGERQAADVAARLKALPLAAVVSSPVERCRQTAQAICAPGEKPSLDGRLAEAGYGDWTGRLISELNSEPLWRVVQRHPSAAVFPGGEAMAAMAARGVAAIRDWDTRISAEHGPDALWVACSHADVIKAVTADALGLHLDQFQRIVVDPASLTVIRYTETRPFLLRLNDVGGDLAGLVPKGTEATASDAVVGGGAGA